MSGRLRFLPGKQNEYTHTMRLRIDLAYDGTDFSGWGVQPDLRTVQGVVEDGLATILQIEQPRLVVAGRTDAGVHATGQVTHLDVPRLPRFELADGSLDVEELENRLAGVLKREPDVVVRRLSLAPEGFDARFSPLARRYEYRLIDDPRKYNPLERHRTVWTGKPLDVDRMNEAAQQLLGLRDFGAFCRPRPGATTIRELQEFSWVRHENGIIVGRVVADAFCHSMVRALVGACVAIGNGRLGVDEPTEATPEPEFTLTAVRDAAERTNIFKVMPAHGLNLAEVIYPPDDELQARADLTRSRRDLPDSESMA
jgi:tRNA pseudouridine38-40 synthase